MRISFNKSMSILNCQIWSEKETFRLCELILQYGKNYSRISEQMPARSKGSIEKRIRKIKNNPRLLQGKYKDALDIINNITNQPETSINQPNGPRVDKPQTCSHWKKQEYDLLMNLIRIHGKQPVEISNHMPGRSQDSVRHKIKYFRENPHTVDAEYADVMEILQVVPKDNQEAKMWSDEENSQLLELIKQHGLDYPKLSENLQRTEKSVRGKVVKLSRDRHLIGEEYSDVRKLIEHMYWTMDDYERLIKGLEECIGEQERGLEAGVQGEGMAAENQAKSEMCKDANAQQDTVGDHKQEENLQRSGNCQNQLKDIDMVPQKNQQLPKSKPGKAFKKLQEQTVYKQKEWDKIAKLVGTKTSKQCMKEYEKLLGEEEDSQPITQTKRPNGVKQL